MLIAEECPVAASRIVKKFGTFTAIHDASLTIRKGEVHAVIGENGAGKSTLMNILYGIHQPTAGTISIDGRPTVLNGPTDAIRAGIGMVHQHFKLVAGMTVTENIIVGHEPLNALGLVDMNRAIRETAALCERYGMALNPMTRISELSVGLRQCVEILKALYCDARVLILDEPTAVLTPQETRELFATMRRFAQSGKSVVFISHKLREVLAVADRISVMRQGRLIATMDNVGLDADQLAHMMVGREVLLRVRKKPAKPSGATLVVEGLSARGELGEPIVNDLSMTVRKGEIVALAGVQGNGQDELVECIAGLRRPDSGVVAICGTAPPPNARARRAAGLAYIPADRGGLGLSLTSPIWENLAVGHLDDLGHRALFSHARARTRGKELIAEFDIRGAIPDKAAGSLSGGNQQKVQLARELTRDTPLIIAEQPSQGVDIGSIESIHRSLVAMRDAGRAVFFISSDLDEVLSLSDRILVMYRGQIVADLETQSTDVNTVGRFMSGLAQDGAAPAADTERQAQNVH